jgi:aminoglycoside 3-N-acetyltransferase
VLLLGVDNLNNTSLHLAEYRADYAGKQEVMAAAPMTVDGARQWVEFSDYNWNSDDFAELGGDFGRESGRTASGLIAASPALLIPQREIVDYAVKWLERKRT